MYLFYFYLFNNCNNTEGSTHDVLGETTWKQDNIPDIGF